ncbi:Dmo2p ASCRUDRAFT_120849 [Ascoidea rubescens DSM 1968]|uniref:DUF4536 domain-containing protein n=1 Tax=Ascoidea rubescens DSM 1968 TaxID=1344418 RepID=A0A1D2VA00_9ASCO|nr:hypothetical protein ASCRUDRAFT_120849 [Ascoidea rubescens DSM 1968]ODV58419.1 hypothetical protein ASCRUDRAFT_120849 [Ascoidea rubescens DSM 1968]
MSNILKIINPPESRDLTDEEVKDCVPCQIMASFTGILGGAYFASGRVFKGEKLNSNPGWWKIFVRSFGAGMIGFGVYRGGQGWLWDLNHEYKKVEYGYKESSRLKGIGEIFQKGKNEKED